MPFLLGAPGAFGILLEFAFGRIDFVFAAKLADGFAVHKSVKEFGEGCVKPFWVGIVGVIAAAAAVVASGGRIDGSGVSF